MYLAAGWQVTFLNMSVSVCAGVRLCVYFSLCAKLHTFLIYFHATVCVHTYLFSFAAALATASSSGLRALFELLSYGQAAPQPPR